MRLYVRGRFELWYKSTTSRQNSSGFFAGQPNRASLPWANIQDQVQQTDPFQDVRGREDCLRQIGGIHDRAVDILHFRDRNGPEVDIIVEQRATGAIAGVEVKASMTPRAEHARHLALLRDGLGDAFTVGVVLHLGSTVVPLGDRLWAVPVPALWTRW